MEKAPVIAIVAALAENRVIGRAGRLPWRLPADLAHFKRVTLHKPIVMGRKTWESLPGLLPERTHIVVTRDPSYRAPGCVTAATPEAAVTAAGEVAEIMVVGGAELYRQMLPRAQRLYLTLVHAEVEGDAFFPEWDAGQWRETRREYRPRDARNPYPVSFVTLERKRPAH